MKARLPGQYLLDFSMSYDFNNNETFIPWNSLKPLETLETVRVFNGLLLKTYRINYLLRATFGTDGIAQL